MTYVELLFVFLGGVGMMTLYIGAQAIMTGERVYRYYAAYALCWISYFFFKVIWTFDDPRIESVIYPFGRIGFPMMAYIFYYRFADALLNLRQLLPRIFWLFRWMEYVLVAYVTAELVVCLFFTAWTGRPAHEWIHTIMRLGVAVVSVYGITQAWNQRNQLAYYFISGSALLLLFGLLSMILSILTIDDSATGQLWQDPLLFLNIGIVLELLCFSLGLSYRNKQTEIQKIIIEQEVIREREQRELAQLKTQFFTNISHEFRTPLTLILGPLTDLLLENPGYATYQLMHRNASRLLALVNQLLDLSKLDAGQLQPAIQSGNLTEWLRVLTGSFSSIADSKDINLTFSTDTNRFDSAYFDRDKTEKIITNLLSNAVKFTPVGGMIHVRLSASASLEAIIQIQDTGIGIPASQQSRIFERFHQVSGDSYSGIEGTGIGLALVLELVNVLRGSVAVDSQPGKGTTFTVQLPVSALSWADLPGAPKSIPTEQKITEEVILPGESLHASELIVNDTTDSRLNLPLLLIIDDNVDVRHYIRQVMTKTFRTIEAVDGQDGLRKASESIPDVVVCDWMMPNMDGITFCQTLKTQPTTNHIPVIMLTAKSTIENRIDGFGRGADEYMTKPFHPVELRVRLENLLAQRQKLRERFSRQLYLKPTSVQVSSVEELFLQLTVSIVEQHLDDSSFSVEQLANALNLSRMQLHRKLKALTNQSATEFVRSIRLQRAADLLAARSATVSEVAFRVGFESLSYFSKSFREQFGVLPSEYEGSGASVT